MRADIVGIEGVLDWRTLQYSRHPSDDYELYVMGDEDLEILAIAIRHAPDVAHEVNCTLDVAQSFARRQADHPADEGTIDTRRIVGRMHVILVALVREHRRSKRASKARRT